LAHTLPHIHKKPRGTEQPTPRVERLHEIKAGDQKAGIKISVLDKSKDKVVKVAALSENDAFTINTKSNFTVLNGDLLRL
jgi:hypothetical protein